MSDGVVLTCPYCGNQTPMKLLKEITKETSAPMAYDDLFQSTDFFELFECPVCDNFHLYHTYMDSEESYPYDYNPYDDGDVLYPVFDKLNLNRLPSDIKNAYESALRVRNIDEIICVVALRRTLEMICKDKGANKGSLYEKLNKLQENGMLPPLMGDLSKVIKDFGNMAVHGDPVTFNKNMVENLFRFINKILEYVYILPREMQHAKQELELSNGKT